MGARTQASFVLAVCAVSFNFKVLLGLPHHADHHRLRQASDYLPEAWSGMKLWLPGWWGIGLSSWQDNVDATLNTTAPYYGQDHEDEYAIQSFFHGRKHGTFLEMGAFDGVALSNTLHFSQALGWRGILIEASPVLYAKLVDNRPNDILLNVAACKSHQMVHFIDAPWAATGGILEFMSESFKKQWHSHLGADELENLPMIPCMPLRSILGKFGVHHIDLWSLDVEGAELQVLETFDFSTVMVDVIVIEADGHDAAKDEAVIDLLKSKGYIYHGHVARNDWFVHESFEPSRHRAI